MTGANSDFGAVEAGGQRRLLIACVLWAALTALSLWLTSPPSVQTAGISPEDASGERAMQVLRRLARDGERLSPPRPAGSAANVACADRIQGEIRALGMEPVLQEEFGAYARLECAGNVRNVLFRLPGLGVEGERQAILCMAHYDSVGAGPGIGDDLCGVAAWLEVARALKASGPLQRDVIFLFEDGEEHGLLGAEVFAAKHPWAKDVGVVVNLEGRGTSGPSRMFETGAGNGWLLDAYKRTARAPSATSLSAEIYRRMPNDTDYTVWRERGIPGLNFAFIGGVNRYHTPLDDLENLSPESLQHHVTSGLDAIRGLDAAEFPTGAAKDAVFFDVMGRTLVVYSTRTARLLAGLALILGLVAASRAIRSGAARWGGVLGGFLSVPGVAVAGVLFAGWQGALRARLTDVVAAPFPAHLAPNLVAVLAASLLGAGVLSWLLVRWVRAAEVGAAAGILLAAAAAYLAWEVPGASFVLTIPALAYGVLGCLMRTWGDTEARWGRTGLVATAVTVPILTALHAGVISAFAMRESVLAAAPFVLGLLVLLPTLFNAGRASLGWLSGLGLIVAGTATGLTLMLSPYSPTRPGQVNLVHVEIDGEATWQIHRTFGPVPAELKQELVAALSGETEGRKTEGRKMERVPWAWQPIAAVEGPVTGEPGPVIEVVGRRTLVPGLRMGDGSNLGREEVTLRVLPGRPSDQLVLDLGVGGLVIDGVSVPSGRCRVLSPREDGVTVTFKQPLDAICDMRVWSKRFGLRGVRGSAADAYFDARPPDYVPAHDGDGSLVGTTMTLEPTAVADPADKSPR